MLRVPFKAQPRSKDPSRLNSQMVVQGSQAVFRLSLHVDLHVVSMRRVPGLMCREFARRAPRHIPSAAQVCKDLFPIQRTSFYVRDEFLEVFRMPRALRWVAFALCALARMCSMTSRRTSLRAFLSAFSAKGFWSDLENERTARLAPRGSASPERLLL